MGAGPPNPGVGGGGFRVRITLSILEPPLAPQRREGNWRHDMKLGIGALAPGVMVFVLGSISGVAGCLARDEPDQVSSESAAREAAGSSSFTEFESGQVRPLALSKKDHLLFA